MLDFISWQQFAIGIFALAAVYYGFVLFFYYRSELQQLFGTKKSVKDPRVLALHPGRLLGEAKPEGEGVELTTAEELDFADVEASGDRGVDVGNNQSMQLGIKVAASDESTLASEIRELISYAAAAGETKKGLLTLIGLYLDRAELSDKAFIIELVLDHCKGKFDFEITSEDLGQFGIPAKPSALSGRSVSKGMFALLILLGLSISGVLAQDGNSGIAEATSKVRSYFTTGCNLMYAIGAVIGLIGAIKVYQKWNGGDGDTGKVAASWFGSCIFLVVVATVLQSFFGI